MLRMCTLTDQSEANGLNPTGNGLPRTNGAGAEGRGEEIAESVRVADSVTSVAGVRALAPGLRDLVATAAAKVLRRSGDEPVGVDVSRSRDSVKVRIDAHLDDTRSVAEVVDEIFSVIAADLSGEAAEADGRLDIDLRVVSRSR
ncbi:hypothetical protein SAMN04489751_2318 [Brevibacterium sandarakinum]|uniref:Uncharacterized protein n=2 Tax=Brevibacterium TaxID=1696 RepID=A0A2H1HMT9_BREAU|nr:hypothetical protein SAMN04489751_2318 [Brevibacterium sandarakinum]SMX64229.1 hypothetical protein BAURA63_00377 [Brevibacterium aurantiacum]